jgi:hypothetical protein
VLFSRRIGRGWWWAAIAGMIAFLLIAGAELLLVWRRRDLSS